MSVNTLYRSRAATQDRPTAREQVRPAFPQEDYSTAIPMPAPVSRPSKRAKKAGSGAFTRFLVVAGTRVTLLGGAFMATYYVAALAGGVNVEGARRQEITASHRADEAAKFADSLGGRVDALTSRDAIDQWAATHGMVNPRVPAAGALVEAGGTADRTNRTDRTYKTNGADAGPGAADAGTGEMGEGGGIVARR